jgi:hypothetical protein
MLYQFSIAWIFLIAQLSLAKTEAPILTQTVGTSAFQVVTSREVKANELLSGALEKEMKIPVVEISQDSVVNTLFETAAFRESQSLSTIQIEADEIDSLVTLVKNRLQKNPEWKRLEVTDAELKSWVERKKISSEYLKLKASSLTTIVTDQEIQDYYEKNRVKFGSTPLEDQKSNIKLYLQKERQRQRIQEWMSALKTKYQIKNDLAELSSDLNKNTAEPKAETSVDSKTSK